ncbi:hypothetical protein GQ44DRAFT_765196 [Phaeosphaeriaceae sp. PMI808]|nr:hypothetical protein GQ44DRAFT_765196 [Phaeosphaeriaceae sp. PMI808]
MPMNPCAWILITLHDRMIRKKFTGRRKKREEWRAKATAAWNARLPAARSSEDTCGVRSTVADVSPQLNSIFFRKLPLEIRRFIYSDILTGKELLLHVVDEDKSLNGDETGKEKIPFKLTCHTARGLLSFPISCKLAYAESFDYLYPSNTFRLAGITEYWCFTRLLSRQYLDLIQDLHLQYSYEALELERDLRIGIPPYRIDWWNNTWDSISRMKGLAHVRVDIHRYTRDPRVHAYDEEFYFSPLKNLPDQVELEVRVSWMKHNSVPPDEEMWPFMIKRDMVYHEENNGTFSLDDE